MTIFTAHYSFPSPAPDSDRAGILGQAAFLALTSKPAETSPTSRGVFVREQLLCQKVADPPPGVNSNLPPVTADRPQTNRERMSAHGHEQPCAGCHQSALHKFRESQFHFKELMISLVRAHALAD
jgi:hypothetical protein